MNIFIFLAFFFLYSIYSFDYSTGYVVFLIILFFYLFEMNFFKTSNFKFNYYLILFNNLNIFLLNNFNKYHPFFLILNVLFFFHHHQLLEFQKRQPFFFVTTCFNARTYFFFSFFWNSVSLCFLTLGSWWAFQEDSWGGWWNWDSSEVLGLLTLFVTILFLHTNISLVKRHCWFYFNKINFYFIFIIYFLVQLNFDNTSHNFGIKFFFFFNNNFFFICLTSFLFLISVWTLFNFFSFSIYSKKIIFNSVFTSFFFYKYIIFVFFSLIFYFFLKFSFNSIFNSFVQILMILNRFDTNFELWNYFLLFGFIFNLMFYTKVNISFFFVFFYCFLIFFNFNVFIFSFLPVFQVIHYILLLFMYTNLFQINLNTVFSWNFPFLNYFWINVFFFFINELVNYNFIIYEKIQIVNFQYFNFFFSIIENALLPLNNYFNLYVFWNFFFSILIFFNYNIVFLEFFFISNIIFFLITTYYFTQRYIFYKKIKINFRILFSRLYNWIRYKTLPTSFLFKNRLFIERDSKHKRIFSNFGNHYRNSKWNLFSTFNVKHHFINFFSSYFIKILFSLILLYVLYYFSQYYINFFFFNKISYIFWSILDFVNYIISFFLWSFFLFLSIFVHYFYLFIFYNKFFNITLSDPSVNVLKNDKIKPTKQLFKPEFNWIFYSWLTNDISNINSPILKNLFLKKFNYIKWSDYSLVFNKLYKTLFLINSNNTLYNSLLISLVKYANVLSNDAKKSNNFQPFLNTENDDTAKNFRINSSKRKNNFIERNLNSSSLKPLHTLHDWSAEEIINEIEKNNNLKKNKKTLSYFHKLESLFSRNSFFLFNKKNNKSSKWNRWLYRYSVLHRKIFKISHKLTAGKKIINSGLNDKKMFKKNLWNSEYLSLLNNKKITNLYNVYYYNLFLTNSKNFFKLNVVSSITPTFNFTQLFHIENSYIWFIKRFLNLNSLGSNTIKKKNFLKKHSTDFNKNNNLLNNFLLFNFFLTNNSFQTFNFFYFKAVQSEPLFKFKNKFYNSKDLNTQNLDNEIFSNLSLQILKHVTTNVEKNNKFNVFNFFIYKDIYALNNEIQFTINEQNYDWDEFVTHDSILYFKDLLNYFNL